MKVAKWGNSLAIRLPVAVAEALELKEGDEVELDPIGRRRLNIRRKLSKEEAIEELRKLRGTVPSDFKFDRDEANARR